MKKIRKFISKVWNKHYASIVLGGWFAIWTIIGITVAVQEVKQMALDEIDVQYLKAVAEAVYEQGEQCIYEVPNDVTLEMAETVIRVTYNYPQFESIEGVVKKGQLVFYHKINYLLVYVHNFWCVFYWNSVGCTMLCLLYWGVKIRFWYKNKKESNAHKNQEKNNTG